MMKTFKRGFLGAVIIGAVIMISYAIFRTDTKSYSPEDTILYQKGDWKMEVFYNRPYKKDRKIFGGLVPYNEVWRTGANEATTFETNKDILVDGSLLKAGKYTLWTIPMQDSWKVIFNSQMYQWGITAEKKPSRIPEYDALVVEVPVRKLKNPLEQFTIGFNEAFDMVNLNLAWDQTLIRVPLRKTQE